jgi:hypothetical protein
LTGIIPLLADFKPPSADDQNKHLIIVVGIAAAAVCLILALFLMQRKGFLGGKVSVDKGMQCFSQMLVEILFFWHLLNQNHIPHTTI